MGESTALTLLLAVPIAVFTLRRALMLGAALAPPRREEPSQAALPTVAVVVPARDEEALAPGLLASLGRLDYPRLSFVLVNDASSDATGARFRAWARDRPEALAIDLPETRGKAGALNRGVESTSAELIFACDADLRPAPDSLRRLCCALGDDRTAAVAAFIAPVEPVRGLVGRYAALESWVHQTITSAGKDRLGLNPPLLGAALYRRDVLGVAGGFPGSEPGEDVRLSAGLARAGWGTRFLADAVVENRVAERWSDYWRQHLRWARNVMRAGRRRPKVSAPRSEPRPTSSVAPRLEALVASLGYADRVAFLAAGCLAATGLVSAWVPIAYLAGVAPMVGAAIVIRARPREVPLYALTAILFFAIDIAASSVAVAKELVARPHSWRSARPARSASPVSPGA